MGGRMSDWTVRIDKLRLQLAVGLGSDEQGLQPVTVSLVAHARTPMHPATLSECFDYVPLLRWLSDEWPRSAQLALLESRLNEIAAYVYRLDARVHRVWVALHKDRLSGTSAGVGLERWTEREDFLPVPATH